MKLTLDSGTGTYVVHSYETGWIRINDERITSSIVVMPDELIRAWPPHTLADLRPDHLDVLAPLAPEIFLLGTGRRLRFPPAATLRALFEQGVGVEVMDTAAACRTYNILSAEGRRVAAGLMMIEPE